MGTGCANGSIMVFGASQERMDPRRKLDFIDATDMTGNLAICSCDARTVNIVPNITSPNETVMADNGPLNAKSSNAARFFGNERSGVIHPKKGSVVA
jgi:hypothetical protein